MEIKLQYVIARIPKCGSYGFCLNKNLIDLLLVITSVGRVVSHIIWLFSRNAWYIAKNTLQWIDIFSWAGENTFDPNATGAKVFFFEFSFFSLFSSIASAYSEARKLAFLMRTFWRTVFGCLRANPQASASAALIASKLSSDSSFTLVCLTASKSS